MTRGDNNYSDIKNAPVADFATSEPKNDRLEHLDVIRTADQFGNNPLRNLKIIVIGAGPAGLLSAKSAAVQGATVVVLEKAGDPHKHRAGYTNRSFNITLDDVGRCVLGGPKAWEGGIWLKGRAIHNFGDLKKIHYSIYGNKNDRSTDLVSIPRTQLRRNMVSQALQEGVDIKFKSHVIKIQPDDGVVVYRDSFSNKHEISGDLIIIGDGINSKGNSLLESRSDEGKIFIRPEPRSYVTARIRTDDQLKLSLQHIHFWHEVNKEAYTVGIPNGDGSVSLLLASVFADFGEFEYPFATAEQAEILLKKDFATLYRIAGDQLIAQLPKKTRGYFKYKAVPSYCIGKKAVLIGDAGCAVPPWAGFGANNAMYGAASLIYQLAANSGSTNNALSIYQAQQLALSRKIMQYVNDEGDFLSGPVKQNPSGRSDEKLCRLIKEAQQEALEELPPAQSNIYSNSNTFAVSDNIS